MPFLFDCKNNIFFNSYIVLRTEKFEHKYLPSKILTKFYQFLHIQLV